MMRSGKKGRISGDDAGLPEAAATIHRLVTRWNVPHDKITFDKLGIGRNFPNHLARYGITTAIPYAGEGRPQDPNSLTLPDCRLAVSEAHQ